MPTGARKPIALGLQLELISWPTSPLPAPAGTVLLVE